MKANTALDFKNDQIIFYPKEGYTYKRTLGRLGECAPDAIRNIYAFFKLKCPLTYKDFQDAGYHNDGAGGVSRSETVNFFSHKTMGLDIKVRQAKTLLELTKNLEKASINNRLAIMNTGSHFYLIFPHAVVSRDELGYTVRYRVFRDQYEDFYVASAYLNSKNLGKILPCFNSFFEEHYPENVLCPINNGLSFVPLSFIFEKLGRPYFIEVKGIIGNINLLKTHSYRWGSVASEYKKHVAHRGERFDFYYSEIMKIMKNCETAENEQYVQIRCYNLLNNEIFSHPCIGREYKSKFDANLPAIKINISQESR